MIQFMRINVAIFIMQCSIDDQIFPRMRLQPFGLQLYKALLCRWMQIDRGLLVRQFIEKNLSIFTWLGSV
jgi:hypothetical protein